MNIHGSVLAGRMNFWITFWCLIGLLSLVSLIWGPQVAAQDASQVSIGGLSGVAYATQGSEVQIYFIQLTEIAGAPDAAVKTVGAGTEEIRFDISDIVGSPTGLVAADISALSFYRSADAIFDAGDALQRSIVPGALGAQTIDFGAPPIATPDIPDAPASIFFLITATISPGATLGHRFRFGAPVLHLDVRETGPNLNYTFGAVITADDGAYRLLRKRREYTGS